MREFDIEHRVTDFDSLKGRVRAIDKNLRALSGASVDLGQSTSGGEYCEAVRQCGLHFLISFRETSG